MVRATELLRNTLRRMGWDAHRYAPDADVANRRQRLLRFLGVDVVVDVGANIGQYGDVLRRNGYAGEIRSFEPLRDAFRQLSSHAASDGHWVAYNVALGDFDGEAEFYVTQNAVSSSLLKVASRPETNIPGLGTSGKENVKVSRLDSIAQPLLSGSERIYLKADVQGGEKSLLLGASETLRRVKAIELELSTVRIYEGQPLYLELASMLDAAGFDLSSVDPVFVDGPTGRMLQFDGIFVSRLAQRG